MYCIAQGYISRFSIWVRNSLTYISYCSAHARSGYDASLLNGLQAMGQWNDYFDSPSGNVLGLISSSLFLPAIITPYITQWISDRYGRKVSLAIGSVILITGAFVNAFAKSLGTFIAGRVLIGAAGPFGKTTAVALLHEIAHPRLRPIVATSFYR